MIKIKGNNVKFNFPKGETQWIIKSLPTEEVDVTFYYESDGEIFQLMLLADAIKNYGRKLGTLFMAYVPYGRQDRINQKGEAFSLKVFANLINGLEFKKVSIVDPHSDVTVALFNNCYIIKQSEYYFSTPLPDNEHYLISPDAGSLKKIYSCVNSKTIEVIECSKKRNLINGEITKTEVHLEDFKGKDCIIVDDICEGGRTFIQIAKILKEKNAGKIKLYITHGFFSKGMKVFDGLINEIYTMKGKVK